MDDSLLVRRSQSAHELHRQRHGQRLRQWSATEQFVQRNSGNQFDDEKVTFVDGIELEDSFDIRMAYPREGDGLVADLMPRHHAANAPRSEQLDGDIAAEPLIVCAIDDAHASGADLLQQTVSPKHSAGMSNGGSHGKGVCAIVGWIAFEVNELRDVSPRRHGVRENSQK